MKKKGFTLVELLAVIIILAVIALIATPLVLNVVDSAKKSAWESSAYGIIEAVKMNSMDEMLAGESMEAVYDFPSFEIDIQGQQPTGGQASVNKQGKVAIAIHNEKWCAIKDYDDAEVTLVDYVEGECTLNLAINNTETPILDYIKQDNICGDTECEDDTVADIVVVPYKTNGSNTDEIYFTIYTVGYITNPETTKTSYTINISDFDIDLEKYTFEVVQSSVMTTQTDFNNYVNMKASGKPATSLVGSTTNSNSAVATAKELYQYSLGKNELIINGVEVSCDTTKCQARINESFQNLDTKTFHQTKTVGGNDLSALYNGIKFTIKLKDRPDGKNCLFSGDLVQGAKFVDGQYTYRYMQELTGDIENYTDISNIAVYYTNMDVDGWSVIVTDPTSTDPVTTELCTTINDKPIVSMAGTFAYSQATEIDFSSFYAGNVVNMKGMFYNSKATNVDIRHFDTSNVINMLGMFAYSSASTVDLTGLDVHNVITMRGMFQGTKATTINLTNLNSENCIEMRAMFYETAAELNLTGMNTSKVTNMRSMFSQTQITTLDLSSFDVTANTDTDYMFSNSTATVGYAKNAATAYLLNNSYKKPDTLTFVVK